MIVSTKASVLRDEIGLLISLYSACCGWSKLNSSDFFTKLLRLISWLTAVIQSQNRLK